MRAPWRISIVLLLLAGSLALLRRREAERLIPGGELRFTETHSVHWDPASRQVARTGDDPYVWVALPDGAIPLREVRIDFGGPVYAGRSGFYIYQFPDCFDGLQLDDSCVTLGQVSPAPGGFSMRWRLANSKILRLDLPDDLGQPVEIRAVRLVSPAYGNWISPLMWICLLAGLALPLAPRLLDAVRCRPWLELALAAGLVALKLILATDLHLAALGAALHDDALFVTQADAIMHGHWLGAFNELTLAKGPVYPLFLAAVGWSGAPLLLAQTFVHALACAVFVRALRPLLPGAHVRLLLFLALLFDPHTLSSESVGRVLRSGLQPALTLCALAGAIGLAARLRAAPRSLPAWSVFAGGAFAAFWYCREEGIWLAPSVLLVGGAAVVQVLRQPGPGRGRQLFLLALPVLVFLAAGALLRGVNARCYGAAIAVDVRDGAFPQAYGALLRLTPAVAQPTVPVARETRLRAYRVSPAFARLEPGLEGPVGDGWLRLSQSAPGAGAADREIRGGWFQWALREAAARAGCYRDAGTADRYWAQVAAELNAACADGRIAAGGPRSGFLPRWDARLWRPLGHSMLGAAAVVVQFSDFGVQAVPFQNPPDRQALFARVTHEPAATAFVPPTWRTAARMQLSRVYRWLGLVATALAGLLTAGLVLRRSWRSLEAAVLLALLGGAFSLITVSALVNVTSFSALHAMYLSPATPLVISSCVLAPFWFRSACSPTSSSPHLPCP